MNCKRCGRSNPPNARRCMYCNTPLYDNSNLRANNDHRSKKKNNQSDKLIFGAIIALVLILVTMAGIYAFQNFAPRKRGFSGGGGGGGAIVSSSAGSGNNGAFSLEASKCEFEVGASDNTVYFYSKPNGNATKVELTDNNGTVLIEMKDDGLYSDSGDDLQNDGVFTAKLSIDVTQENVSYYSAKSNGSKSNVEKISVIARLTNEELSAIRKVQTSFETLRNSDAYKQMSIEDRKKAVIDNLNQLSQEGLVKAQSIYDDTKNNVVTYYHTCGVMAMEGLKEYDFLHAGNGATTVPQSYGDSVIKQYANNQGVSPKLSVDAGNATILYAWGNPKSGEWKDYYQYCEKMQGDWNKLGLNTTIDSDVTINDLKNIKDKNFVYIGAHGGYGTFSYEYDVEYKWFFQKTSKQNSITVPGVVFLEKSNKNKDSEYSLDLKSGRVFIYKDAYGIAPAFFDKYYDSDDLEDAIFFWGSCQLFGVDGTIREDWANVLNNKAIKAFVGFHNSNYIFYHYNLLDILVPDLVDGKTIKEALDHATSVQGTDDVVWFNKQNWKTTWFEELLKKVNLYQEPTAHSQAAYPLLRGDNNATLVNLSLKNGNFEADTAIIKNWKKTGDVRLLSKLGDVAPQEGSLMSILTTGIGSGQSTYLNSTEGSSLYQTFKIPDNKTTVSFDYNIISEEPTEYVGSKFDDKFYAEILNSKGEVVKTLASETVNNSAWTEVNGINFDGGDDTVYQTGWKNISGDVSDLKGQIVTIRFVVFDVGDSQYDTAAVVDNVVLK